MLHNSFSCRENYSDYLIFINGDLHFSDWLPIRLTHSLPTCFCIIFPVRPEKHAKYGKMQTLYTKAPAKCCSSKLHTQLILQNNFVEDPQTSPFPSWQHDEGAQRKTHIIVIILAWCDQQKPGCAGRHNQGSHSDQ